MRQVCAIAFLFSLLVGNTGFAQAVDDYASTEQNTAVNINVLVNDVTNGGLSQQPIYVVYEPFDGTTAVNTNGTPNNMADDYVTYTPDLNYNGVDTFVYQITDAAMVTTMATVYIIVTPTTDANDPPTAVDDLAYVTEDNAITISVLQNDFFGSDGPEGGSITIYVNPAHGTAVVNDNGTPDNPIDDTIIYNPNANYAGEDSFEYRITDLNGNTDTAIVMIYINEDSPPYEPPFAGDDTVTAMQDAPVVIAILSNDTFGSVGPGGFGIASQPLNGTATLNSNGTLDDPTDDTITYVPYTGYAGVDSFTYTITDSYGSVATATVTITIVVDTPGEAPVAANDNALTDQDTPVTIAVLANDSFGAYGPGSISVASQPAHGTAIINNNGTPNATDDAVTYIPNLNYNGVDSFTYQIMDAMMVTSTATVTITIAPPASGGDPPTATDDFADTAEDIEVTIEVLQNDTFGSEGPAVGSIGISAMPTNGIAVINNNGTPNNPADDTITYSPNANYFGQDVFAYTITNALGDTDVATVTITVHPDTSGDMPPYAGDDFVVTSPNTAVSVAVLANDTFGDFGPGSIAVENQPLHGTLAIDNSATPDDVTDDFVVYTPTACYNGVDSFTYLIFNSEGDSASATVTIIIVPDAPTETYEEVTACDSFTWNGITYTESGDYTYESTNASGCATIAMLYLTINNSTTTSEEVTACDSYTWNGETYNESGDYIYESTNGAGCMNIAMLHLVVNRALPPTATSPQSFCSGSIADLSATGNDIKWYHTATGGIALASDTALESGTYYASQSVGGCEGARTAVSVTVQVAMPSAPSPQAFVCGAKRANLSATGTAIRWYTVPSGGTAMDSGELLVSGTYYVSQMLNGCQSSRRVVEVTVNMIAPPTATDQTFCYNSTVQQLTATGTDLRWYLTGTGGSVLLHTTGLTAGTYYVSQKTGTCESARTAIQVTLSGPALPDAPAVQSYNCGARRSSLLAMGTGLRWYASATGGSALLSSTQLVTGSYYVSQTIGGCEGPRREVSVTIINTTPPTASMQYLCTAATVANLIATGTSIKWYASDTNTTPLASTTPLETGTYYASQTNAMLCESARTAVQVIMGGSPMPDAPSPQTLVCGAKRPALIATGTSLLWYTVSSGGTALSSTAVLVTGTYYVSQTISGCVSARRAVSVIITSPAAPTASAQVFCSGATVANLYANGANIKWYTAASGGLSLAGSTQLVSGTYYASQSAGSCESGRTSVIVTVNTTTMPDAPSPQVFSCNVKRPSLTATGTSLMWYTSATGGFALSSTAQLYTGTYYVSQILEGCTSARRAVSVVVNATAPPTVSGQVLCNGALVTGLTATGTAIRWYTAATGGMPLSSSTPLLSGTYYASQTVTGCESLRSASNVTLTDCAVRAPEMAQPEPTANIGVTPTIRIFPNPATSFINIMFGGEFIIGKIVIIDSAGRVVLEQDGSATEVDVTRLARGVYIIRAFSGEKRYQSKFIKE